MLRPQFRPLSRCGAQYAAGGDTKTMKSRRTIALPDLCVRTLVTLRVQQDADRRTAGERWHETGLVFTTRLGTAMDAANVRRDFRRALALVPGLKPDEWTPRAALRRGRADRRRLPARGPQQHQRDGTCLPASDSLVTQALYINSSATIEMRSDKAEQWSG